MNGGGGSLGNFNRWRRDRRPHRAVVPKPPADDVNTRYHVFPEFPSKKTKSSFHVSNTAQISPPPPLDDEDVVGEILCRLPPQPSSFLHASLVCKLWGRLATSAAFRPRLLAHHHHVPVLGVYVKHARTLMFIPALDAPDRVPPERFSLKVCADHTMGDNWAVLGCRHGRVLVINRTPRELLVFDPVSVDRRVVAFPPDFVDHSYTTSGAVVCEDGGLGQSSKFWVVLVGLWGNGGETNGAARVYSSETGLWGDLLTAPEPCRVGRLPCTLVNNVLYWWLAEPDLGSILQFDLGSQKLDVISKPPMEKINIGCSRIVRTEDGGAGLAVLSYPTLQMYYRKASSHGVGVTSWSLRKIVEMDKLLGLPASMDEGSTYITGYAEDAGAIVLSVHHQRENYSYLLQLESMHNRKLHGSCFLENAYHPFANFYTGGNKCLIIFALLQESVASIRCVSCASKCLPTA